MASANGQRIIDGDGHVTAVLFQIISKYALRHRRTTNITHADKQYLYQRIPLRNRYRTNDSRTLQALRIIFSCRKIVGCIHVRPMLTGRDTQSNFHSEP